jgi:hypothetical protein
MLPKSKTLQSEWNANTAEGGTTARLLWSASKRAFAFWHLSLLYSKSF